MAGLAGQMPGGGVERSSKQPNVAVKALLRQSCVARLSLEESGYTRLPLKQSHVARLLLDNYARLLLRLGKSFYPHQKTSAENACEPNQFNLLCDNVNTSMIMLNNSLQELFGFKDELLKHALPPKLLVQVTVMASKIFRCFSDLCTPVGELTRLARVHSTSWEEKGEVMRKLRTDFESMQRQLSIALKRIEMMAAEEERIKHERRVMNWERLFARLMGAKSHGRRWKFRIEPFRRKLEDGYNPYVSDSSDESEDETNKLMSPLEGSEEELKNIASDSDDGDSERSPSLSSHSERHASSSQKRVRFADMDPPATPPSPDATPPPAPPTVETCDATTWTEEPQYNNYLLVQMFRPRGMMSPVDQDLCCMVSLGDQFHSSKPFPNDPNSLMHQDFHFTIPDDVVTALPPNCKIPLDSPETPKLSVAVYLRNISGDMMAHTSIPLQELTLTEESTTIIPPDSSEELFEVDWEDVAAGIQASPAEYLLRIRGGEGYEDTTPLIPLICHRVKVQRHRYMHSGTTMMPWDELLTELGYHHIPDMLSRAVSAIQLEEAFRVPSQDEMKSEEAEELISAEEMAEVMLKHTEEMRKLQHEYEHRLEALSRTLARVKAEKATEISQLEQALMEAEQRKGKKFHPSTSIRELMAQKRRAVTHGLPKWGEDLPEDFFERLELFAEESVRKHAELTERIRKEVSEACEKQLATQHRLAPGLPANINTTTEDVSLPALFMPTVSSKNLVYTPRAHGYFHPPGSTDSRITQPPAVFKLPALHRTHLPNLNLFELSQHFSQKEPQWLKEHHHQSPRYTPAPPPSACGFYRQDMTTPIQHDTQ